VKKALSHGLRLALTVAVLVALVLFARTVDWRATWVAIRGADWWILLLAIVVNLLSLVLKGVRWWVFLRPVGARSLWLALKASFAGAGLNNILVANGGEAARVIFVSRAAHLQSARVLATLALERMFEVIGYVLLLALSASFLALPESIARMRPVAWVALAGIAVLLIYLIRRPDEPEIVLEHAVGWRGRTAAYLRHFLSTLAGISTGPRFGAAILLSVAIWALQVGTYALTAMSGHFPLPLVGTVAALLAVNIGFVVRATPGNVGLFQAIYALTAVGFGMDKEQAIAVAFLIQAQQIIPVTLLGVALAPEFIFKRKHAARSTDHGLDLESRPPRSRGRST
jgi:uncharacterized protein (TIRG00374 family)